MFVSRLGAETTQKADSEASSQLDSYIVPGQWSPMQRQPLTSNKQPTILNMSKISLAHFLYEKRCHLKFAVSQNQGSNEGHYRNNLCIVTPQSSLLRHAAPLLISSVCPPLCHVLYESPYHFSPPCHPCYWLPLPTHSPSCRLVVSHTPHPLFPPPSRFLCVCTVC